jgi:hypothetical protein
MGTPYGDSSFYRLPAAGCPLFRDWQNQPPRMEWRAPLRNEVRASGCDLLASTSEPGVYQVRGWHGPILLLS